MPRIAGILKTGPVDSPWAGQQGVAFMKPCDLEHEELEQPSDVFLEQVQGDACRGDAGLWEATSRRHQGHLHEVGPKFGVLGDLQTSWQAGPSGSYAQR